MDGAGPSSDQVRWHQKLLGNIADTVTVVAPDGVPLWTSAGRNDALGFTPTFWGESSIFELVHPDELPTVTRWLDELLDSPKGEVAGEVRLRDPDGNYSHVGFRCVNLIDDPDVGGIVIAARSVEAEVQRRRLQAKQHEQFESQLAGHSALIADVSHEMRAPIHAVLGLTELLLADASMTFDQRRDLETVQREAASLKTMVDELLDLSKLGADRVELQSEPFSPSGLVDDVARAFVPLAQAKGLKLSVQIDPTVPLAVIGDEFRVRQILTNLLSNAVKYTDDGTVVLAVGATSDGAVEFSVADTGRGIPERLRESIFEAYTQARSEDVATGTGIGLAIARRLARMMDGDLSFDSLDASAESGSSDGRQERGTTFYCTLPLPVGRRESDHALSARHVARTPAPSTPRPVDVDRERRIGGDIHSQDDVRSLILVVDDSEVNRMLANSQLERLGHQAVLAEGATMALEILSKRTIDLVLMDWHMPEIDGLEATRMIRTSGSSFASIPIVAVTASALVDDRQTCLDAGMDDYMSKPVSLADLEAMVAKWLPLPADPRAEALNEHLDMSIVDGLRDDLGSDEIVASVVKTFIGELDRLALEIATGAAEDNAEGVRRAAHTVKSSASMLGATRLGSVSKDLEARASDEVPDLSAKAKEFGDASADARSALIALVARLESGGEDIDRRPTATHGRTMNDQNTIGKD